MLLDLLNFESRSLTAALAGPDQMILLALEGQTFPTPRSCLNKKRSDETPSRRRFIVKFSIWLFIRVKLVYERRNNETLDPFFPLTHRVHVQQRGRHFTWRRRAVASVALVTFPRHPLCLLSVPYLITAWGRFVLRLTFIPWSFLWRLMLLFHPEPRITS